MTVTGSREALKGCPFCRATPHRGLEKMRFDQLHGDPLQDYAIWCPKGHAKTTAPTEALAIEAWNTRASPDPAGVTLTLEEIARALEDQFKRTVEGNSGKSFAETEVHLPVEAFRGYATAILSLIRSKIVQPRIVTKPATSGTAAPVCELGGEG